MHWHRPEGSFMIPIAPEFVVDPPSGPDQRKVLLRMVQTLAECGHDHNFVIAFDGNQLYCTELAVECLDRDSAKWQDNVIDIRPKVSSDPARAAALAYQQARVSQASSKEGLIELADRMAIHTLNARSGGTP